MASSKNSEYQKTSFLSKSNSAFIEQMYLKFINRESDLPESWKKYFCLPANGISSSFKKRSYLVRYQIHPKYILHYYNFNFVSQIFKKNLTKLNKKNDYVV